MRAASLLDAVTERLRSEITAQGLVPGDRLPPASEMARSFGVALPTFRSAVARLESVGMLEVRQGAGTFVKQSKPGLLVANPGWTLEPMHLLEVVEARIVLEPALARRAAKYRTEDDLTTTQHLLDALGEKTQAGVARNVARAAMSFHGALAKMAANAILAETIQSIISVNEHEQFEIALIYNDPIKDHREHVQIFEAIRLADSRLAARRMEQHLRGVHRVVAAAVERYGGPKPPQV